MSTNGSMKTLDKLYYPLLLDKALRNNTGHMFSRRTYNLLIIQPQASFTKKFILFSRWYSLLFSAALRIRK